MLGASLFFTEEVVAMTSLLSKKINSDSAERVSMVLGQLASAAYMGAGMAMRDGSLIVSGIIFGIAINRQMHADKSDLAVAKVPQGASIGRRMAVHAECILQNIRNRSMVQSSVLEVVGVAASASALYNILPATAATAIIGMEFLGVSFLAMADGVEFGEQKAVPAVPLGAALQPVCAHA